MTGRFPYGPFGRAIALRSVLCWLGVRAGLALLGSLPGVSPGGAVFLALPAAALAVAVSASLAGFETRRLNEDLFLANLGVSRTALWGIASGPAVVCELVAQLLASL